MTLWLFFALLTAICIYAIVAPALRAAPESQALLVESTKADLAVYRDQLDEITRDLDRGVISKTEALAAEIEIKRRMLSTADSSNVAEETSSKSPVLIFASAVGVPIIALGLYISFGSPAIEGQPLASRIDTPATETTEVNELIARVEKHLRDKPNDGRGWEVIAPVYLSIGRADEAVSAYQRAINLLGETSDRSGGLGEAIVGASGGVVSGAARSAFEAELRHNPDSARAKFYLALGAEQDGDLAEARKQWKGMLGEALGMESWLPEVRQRLAAVEEKMGVADSGVETRRLSGPSAEDVEAASEMTADQRRDMVMGMVANLDERISSEGGSPEEWERLIQSYAVLNMGDAAHNAVLRARVALKSDANALERINAMAFRMGLGG